MGEWRDVLTHIGDSHMFPRAHGGMRQRESDLQRVQICSRAHMGECRGRADRTHSVIPAKAGIHRGYGVGSDGVGGTFPAVSVVPA